LEIWPVVLRRDARIAIKEQQIRSGLKFVSFARDGSVIPAAPETEVTLDKAMQPTEPAGG
jgi:hypothetical protein